MNFYISDLHICHANTIKFDKRPFADLNEMHRAIIDNWNSRVKTDDTVYILGDFIWYKENEWIYYVEPLAGNKVLIRGNHDPRQFSASTNGKDFVMELVLHPKGSVPIEKPPKRKKNRRLR